MTSLEIMHPEHLPRGRIRAAIFDFDGTISTLRCGWEKVMRAMMLEYISGQAEPTDALKNRVNQYIDASTGIQTVYQMKWLAEEVEKAGFGYAGRDLWWYKDEYNRRLMAQIRQRLRALEKGTEDSENYLIEGSVSFLKELKRKEIPIYLASGTDHEDVVHEATVLGVAEWFTKIKGAPRREMSCSKEAVIKMLLEENGLPGDSLLLVGDGKVEIALGAECGAYTIGAATNEIARRGVNAAKRERLIKAGADVIVGDFENLETILSWLGLAEGEKNACHDRK